MIAAVLDASVLCAPVARRLLLDVAAFGVYRPVWSEPVLDQWVSRVTLANPSCPPDRIAEMRALLTRHAGPVMSNMEDMHDLQQVPDAADRLMVAAAFISHASVIVTCEPRRYPPQVLIPYGVEVRSPNEFLMTLDGADPDAMVEAAAADRASLRPVL
jgi:hypothetical protein